jgi:anaerobic selenocysteine-containing dehydrogenase
MLPTLFPGKTKSVYLIGSNPYESWTWNIPGYVAAKEAGAKYLVVDPRFTQTVGNFANIWLQIRSGTDTALNLALVDVIIEEDLYDHEFVETWCCGFDKLKERVKEYPPEKVAEICCSLRIESGRRR